MDAVVGCPACGETLEVALPLADLTRPPDPPATDRVAVPGAGEGLVVRCPTSRDLLAAAASADPTAALLARCVTGAGGTAVDPASLAGPRRAAVDAVAERLAGRRGRRAARGLPSLRRRGEGGRRRHRAGVATDLPGSARVLAEVAELSAAFGWSEADVLAMSRVRRDAYLALVRGRE